MAHHNSQSATDPWRDSAQWVYDRLAADKRIPHQVIEDGCFERAEAMIGIMRTELKVDPKHIGRAFNINPDPEQSILTPNPLNRNNSLADLKRHLRSCTAHTPLSNCLHKHGFIVVPGQKHMLVHVNSAIILSHPETVRWSTGHVAPMVGPYVVDPSMGKGILTLGEWKRAQGLTDSIPLRARDGQLAELVPSELSEVALTDMEKRLDLKPSGDREQRDQAIIATLLRLPEAGKNQFYDGLFAKRIAEGKLYPRQHWNEAWLGKIDTRGEYGIEDNLARRGLINQALRRDWISRKDTALAALEPFCIYSELAQDPDGFVSRLQIQRNAADSVIPKARHQS